MRSVLNFSSSQVTSSRKIIAKFINSSAIDQMFILLDENIPVFQKAGVIAAAIFIVSG
jgi:hypothetical protein